MLAWLLPANTSIKSPNLVHFQLSQASPNIKAMESASSGDVRRRIGITRLGDPLMGEYCVETLRPT